MADGDGDAWNEIQELKSKTSNLRAKLAARKKEREGLAAEISKTTGSSPVASTTKAALSVSDESAKSVSPGHTPKIALKPEPIKHNPAVEKKLLVVVEKKLLVVLSQLGVETYSSAEVAKKLDEDISIDVVENLLQKFAAQQLIVVSADHSKSQTSGRLIIQSVDLPKLSAVTDGELNERKRKATNDSPEEHSKPKKQDTKVSVESLLSAQTAKEKESKKMTEEILQLLSAPTSKEKSLMERFKSQGGAQLQEFCQFETKEGCKAGQPNVTCKKLHFKKIIHKHTDESLGDCSFLNTCFHMDTCKYVHYQVDYPEVKVAKRELNPTKMLDTGEQVNMFPPQWVQCDIRYLDMAVLGKCAVIMADPPWDIHMELPYGTMSDDEMRKMPVPKMQDDGYMFLWVTGRAMELGRECLEQWGYKRIDEIIWVKTNQLQRIIRTGRTGHWFNHGKEHCLVGVKGNPKGVNKGLDCDVIVAEVRATSHKPDEIYGIIERLSPGTRKVELFGRPHNVQPNWITLGNQLEGVRLVDPEIVTRFKEKYPDGNCMGPSSNDGR
ncbi:N6-adenosine-methyltransferase catalytic subunit-like [Dreissena polymorpha]|uniref:mRNA m(6)A methyltransferase n=1 Tax=Dreissena polymorpha TaxID=45954 RepID=A0A9D3Z6G5_DREPO|nr:N6-adenosine-methyltransferase catalytic subunit-like [Dreissena polymorpha]KAH3711089.1 hypothetical protein DPMN_070589 [Dreissena polymorpha]